MCTSQRPLEGADSEPMADPTPTPEPRTEQEIGCPHGAWGMVVACPHCGTPRHVTPSEFVTARFLREVEAGQREWPRTELLDVDQAQQDGAQE